MKENLEDFGLAIVEEAFGIIMCCVMKPMELLLILNT